MVSLNDAVERDNMRTKAHAVEWTYVIYVRYMQAVGSSSQQTDPYKTRIDGTLHACMYMVPYVSWLRVYTVLYTCVTRMACVCR